MMALATQRDVEARLQRPLTQTELDSLDGLLDEANALLTGYLGYDYSVVTDQGVPSAVTVVASRMVARTLQVDPDTLGAQQMNETTGPFNRNITFAPDSRNGGVWLTKADKLTLRAIRPSMVSLSLRGDHR